MLTIQNLQIRFKNGIDTIEAVRGIDFSIRENEIVGLVGGSGSGKTVTALSLLRLLPKRSCELSGKIFFEGKNMIDLNEEEIRNMRGSEIAMIFQEPFTSLNPVLKVGGQVDEVILAHEKASKKEARSRTLSLFEKVRMSDPERMYDSYPHLLSGGERQRAMIAMAIALRPKLLIADEPTTALDVTIQAEILDLLLLLKKEMNIAVLFITHDFGIIEKIAERILVMKDGKIVEEGRKVEILSSPKDDYTKTLLEAVEKPVTDAGMPERETTSTAIIVKNLNRSFVIEKGIFKKEAGRVFANRDINFELKAGKTLGIVGESGSGKTTLAKLIVGLLRADSGEISASRQDMQIVFQDPFGSLDPRMRMRDIVLEGMYLRGASRKEKESALKNILFKVHMNYNDRLKYPHQFSGGERQRIAIARALAVKPKILVLDEPVSSLDVIIQRDILNLLKDLQHSLGLSYIFISHDLRIVGCMADHVAVMRKGEIVEYAPRNEIYTNPRHPYTKKLLAS